MVTLRRRTLFGSLPTKPGTASFTSRVIATEWEDNLLQIYVEHNDLAEMKLITEPQISMRAKLTSRAHERHKTSPIPRAKISNDRVSTPLISIVIEENEAILTDGTCFSCWPELTHARISHQHQHGPGLLFLIVYTLCFPIKSNIITICIFQEVFISFGCSHMGENWRASVWINGYTSNTQNAMCIVYRMHGCTLSFYVLCWSCTWFYVGLSSVFGALLCGTYGVSHYTLYYN